MAVKRLLRAWEGSNCIYTWPNSSANTFYDINCLTPIFPCTGRKTGKSDFSPIGAKKRPRGPFPKKSLYRQKMPLTLKYHFIEKISMYLEIFSMYWKKNFKNSNFLTFRSQKKTQGFISQKEFVWTKCAPDPKVSFYEKNFHVPGNFFHVPEEKLKK